MTKYVIRNRVLSADEMGRKLGLSERRVKSVRVIMSSPSTRKFSKRSNAKSRSTSKRVSAKRSSGRR